MVEYIIIIISLVIGIMIGWMLKSKTQPKDMQGDINRLIAEKSSAEAKLQNLEETKKGMESVFKSLASDIAKENSKDFLNIAGEKFKDISNQADENLIKKKELIDQKLGDIEKTQKSLHNLSVEIKGNLKTSSIETQKLREILSSSQKRGQWGERLVEDILNSIGFVKDKNFTRQTLVESGERPDFTFILPDNKKLNMDVKFPWDRYRDYLDSEHEEEQKALKDAFLKDVENHIKTVATRAYINPAEGTLDYVLFFIPNESIYAFVNKENTDLIDFALDRKVLLCSPITLYAILSLINQASRNFAMEQKAAEMMNLVNSFRTKWDMFVDQMDKMGKKINETQTKYDELVGTRRRMLEKPMSKINDMIKGDEVTELVE